MELKEQGRGSAGSAELVPGNDGWKHISPAGRLHSATLLTQSALLQSEANNNQLINKLNILWSHKSLQVKAPKFLTQDRFEILLGTSGWSLMERSLVRTGGCSEVSRCFITEIFCALMIYIERQSGNGQTGRGGSWRGAVKTKC